MTPNADFYVGQPCWCCNTWPVYQRRSKWDKLIRFWPTKREAEAHARALASLEART